MLDPKMALLSLLLLLPLSLLLLLFIITRPRSTRVPIKNRHALITGGSSGIGLALLTVSRRGCTCDYLARDQSKAGRSEATIRLSTWVDVTTLSVTSGDFDALKKVLDYMGPSIDVLVCNQGVFVPKELESRALDEIRFMIDVNLMGCFNLIKAALPLIKCDRDSRGPGSIAIMSSWPGRVGIYGYTAYSASKFGVRGLAEALQQEVIADDIHVSLIFPPDTETPGLEQENKLRPVTKIIASPRHDESQDVAKKAINGIKSGRFIIPCNFEGFLLSIIAIWFVPTTSYLMAFTEVIFLWYSTHCGLFFQWDLV
ncbi:3-dehydrosphinganine reductase TSC10A-like [Silene latifolia]|uniref:3-dehydrosphinganine reductase TSC10A-like n=1 Tax=Silene latifolia TaxID=37657 RepID=UPI003D7721B1